MFEAIYIFNIIIHSTYYNNILRLHGVFIMKLFRCSVKLQRKSRSSIHKWMMIDCEGQQHPFLHFSRNEKRFGINYLWSFFSSSTWHSGDNIIWSKAVLSKHLYRRIWFKDRITVSAWIHLKKIIPLFNFSVLLFTLGMAHSCSIWSNLNHPFHVRIKYNFKTTGKFYKASPPLYLIRILCTSPTEFPVTLIPINQIISQLYK